jgi:L-threonylcarbamoyladenylate synthase
VRSSVQLLTDVTLCEATTIVREGGLIAFPTETFYGLGVLPFNEDAVRRLFAVKQRAPVDPVLVLIRGREDLNDLVTEITPAADLLMNAYWPGPLTLIFRAAPKISTALTGGTGTIGLRFSSSTAVCRLLEELSGPLTGTSANRSGGFPATTAQEVEQALGSDVDLILDGGRTAGGLPSTVVDTTVTPARLIREGVLSKSTVLSVIGTLAA